MKSPLNAEAGVNFQDRNLNIRLLQGRPKGSNTIFQFNKLLL